MSYKFLISSLSDSYNYNCFSIHNDESNKSLGAVSKNINPSKNYPLHKKDNLPKLNPILKFTDAIIGKRYLPKDTGIVPPGLLAVTGKYIVFERPPEYKNIFVIPSTVSEMNDGMDQYVYRIPVPWTLYFIQYSTCVDEETSEIKYYASNVRMHFMQTNLRSHDQEVFLPPLPNFYTSGNLCRPMFANMEDTERYSKDVAGCIETAYDWIWNCGTNLDLTESCIQMFTQFSNSNINDTVFRSRYNSIPIKFNSNSYYLNMSALDTLLTAWQNISIDEVCDLKWPSTSLKGSFHHSGALYSQENLENYLNSIGQSIEYEYHYDDDTEEPYQCDYDECECRTIVNNYNKEEFLAWLGIWPPKPITYKQSFENFIVSLENNFEVLPESYTKIIINTSLQIVDSI